MKWSCGIALVAALLALVGGPSIARAQQPGWVSPQVEGVKGLATYLFVAKEGTGNPMVIRIIGRPLTGSEKAKIGSPYTDVQVNGNALRKVEAAAREAGFMAMDSGGGAKTISAYLDGAWKTVSSDGSAEFDKVWDAIQAASVSLGSSRRDID